MIAEFVARELYGETVESTSAGVLPQKADDAANAIDCLKNHFRIDATGHAPRNINQLDVTYYDYVIVMDQRVANQFTVQYPSYPDGRLIRWRIKDPWGDNLDEYRVCALTITKELRKLRVMLPGPPK